MPLPHLNPNKKQTNLTQGEIASFLTLSFDEKLLSKSPLIDAVCLDQARDSLRAPMALFFDDLKPATSDADGDEPAAHLIRCGVGIGKSRSAREQIETWCNRYPYGRIAVRVPMHTLGLEWVEKLNEAGVNVGVYYGMEAIDFNSENDSGEPTKMCHRMDEVKAWRKGGGSAKDLCGQSVEENGLIKYSCPLAAVCGFQKQHDLGQCQVVIIASDDALTNAVPAMAKSYDRIQFGLPQFDATILDESAFEECLTEYDPRGRPVALLQQDILNDMKRLPVEMQNLLKFKALTGESGHDIAVLHRFDMCLGKLRKLIDICTGETTEEMVAGKMTHRNIIRQITLQRVIEAGFNGVDMIDLKKTNSTSKSHWNPYFDLAEMDLHPSDIEFLISKLYDVRFVMDASGYSPVVGSVQADEIAQQQALYIAASAMLTFLKAVDQGLHDIARFQPNEDDAPIHKYNHHIAQVKFRPPHEGLIKYSTQRRQKFNDAYTQRPMLIMDAVAQEKIVKRWISNIKLTSNIDILDGPGTKVLRMTNNSLSHSSMRNATSDGRTWVHNIAKWTDTFSQGKTLLTCSKDAESAIQYSDDMPDSLETTHFGGIRGLDQYKDHRNHIIAGRIQLGVDDLERHTEIITGKPIKNPVPYPTTVEGGLHIRPLPAEAKSVAEREVATAKEVARSIARNDALIKDGRGNEVSRMMPLAYSILHQKNGQNHIHAVPQHPDADVEMIRMAKSEGEQAQVLGRLRTASRSLDHPATVYEMHNLSSNRPIDAMFTPAEANSLGSKLANIVIGGVIPIGRYNARYVAALSAESAMKDMRDAGMDNIDQPRTLGAALALIKRAGLVRVVIDDLQEQGLKAIAQVLEADAAGPVAPPRTPGPPDGFPVAAVAVLTAETPPDSTPVAEVGLLVAPTVPSLPAPLARSVTPSKDAAEKLVENERARHPDMAALMDALRYRDLKAGMTIDDALARLARWPLLSSFNILEAAQTWQLVDVKLPYARQCQMLVERDTMASAVALVKMRLPTAEILNLEPTKRRVRPRKHNAPMIPA